NKLAPIIIKILFNTRKSLQIYIYDFYNFIYKKDNYSVFLLYILLICRSRFKNIIFKLFTLIKNYLYAQLVEVKNNSSILHIEKNIYKASQRLNTKNLQWFIGFTDGDGCFSVYKEKKYQNNWRHEFSIGLQIKDIRLLYKIKNLLGCGTVKKYNNVAVFRIKKLKHLVYQIIPLFDKFPLLTEKKRIVYLNFRNTLLNKFINSKIATNEDINFVKNLLNNNDINILYNTPIEKFLNNIDSNYFDNWLVGFTEAEGSFYFIKNKNLKDNISQIPLKAEFRLSQNNNVILLTKIKEKLKLTRNVNLQTNSSNHYYIVASSIDTIQNTIYFYTNPSIVKFKGIKYLKFILWLKGIKNINRYKNIKIPNNYGGDSS
nr:orf372 [Zancudomyces culisetae]AAW49509.1 orf372 [Zancudomyces culisetae]